VVATAGAARKHNTQQLRTTDSGISTFWVGTSPIAWHTERTASQYFPARQLLKTLAIQPPSGYIEPDFSCILDSGRIL